MKKAKTYRQTIVISIQNQKGGVGKTTATINLARGLERRGYTVLVIDSDPQGTLRDWSAFGGKPLMTVIGIDRPILEDTVKDLGHYDFILIDGAGRYADITISAIRASDIVLIPVQPSLADVWAARPTISSVKERMAMMKGTKNELQAAFVVWEDLSTTNLQEEVIPTLRQFELPILRSHVSQRAIYRRALYTGESIFELADARAIEEMDAVVSEVIDHVEGRADWGRVFEEAGEGRDGQA